MDQIARRQFLETVGKGILGTSLVLATGSEVFILEGCTVTVSQILSNLNNWIPVALSSVTAILTLLGPAGASEAAAVTLIKAGWAQVQADIKIYESITPPPTGLLSKIEAGLQVLVTNYEAFLSSMNIPDTKTATLIAGLAQIVLNAIAAFANQLNTASPTPTAAKATMHIATAKTVTVSGIVVTPVANNSVTSTSGFKRSWNKVAKAGGHPEIELSLSMSEKMHL